MSVAFRICLLGLLLIIVWACANRDDARNQAGLPSQSDATSKVPAATPGPGYERVQIRPDSTPTPPPSNPMDKPLDPTGFPTGGY